MADESAPAVRALPMAARRGLLLAGLAVAGWSVTRVVRLVSGDDSVVADDDPHGYVAIFSLVLTPVLALAVVTLVTATVDLWRRGRSRHLAPGVALALSAPLASPLALAALAVGAAIVAAAVVDRRTRP
ncbi:hypothetical protein [Actinophytocola sp. NPDC049390]|uniref:hypothetical protein n=1 Tax=Actinophytocola sp. NPDC049390 TaxID=3363894 RepID=UPI0037B756EE